MAKAKGKKGKQLVSDKKEQPKYPIKTSWECTQCKQKCPEGLDYIKRMSSGGARGNGCVCKELT